MPAETIHDAPLRNALIIFLDEIAGDPCQCDGPRLCRACYAGELVLDVVDAEPAPVTARGLRGGGWLIAMTVIVLITAALLVALCR